MRQVTYLYKLCSLWIYMRALYIHYSQSSRVSAPLLYSIQNRHWDRSFLFICSGHTPNSAMGHKSILSSLWFTFLQEGVYLLLTVYRTGVGYWGSEFLIYLWRSRNQKLRWVTNLYILSSLWFTFLSTFCLQVTKPKSAVGEKSILLPSLWFTF